VRGLDRGPPQSVYDGGHGRILDPAATAIAEYNRVGLHYNLIADAIYRARDTMDPFSSEYEPYIIAGLLVFDMGRMMGAGDKYNFSEAGFRTRLRAKMASVREQFEGVPLVCLHQVDLVSFADRITEAYKCLAASGEGALGDHAKKSHRGAAGMVRASR
jgi:hypothetical protein